MFFGLSLIQITVLAVFIYLVSWIIYCRCFHPLRSIPGPFLASISRAWIVFKTAHGDMERTQRTLHKKHGNEYQYTDAVPRSLTSQAILFVSRQTKLPAPIPKPSRYSALTRLLVLPKHVLTCLDYLRYQDYFHKGTHPSLFFQAKLTPTD